MAKFVRAPFHLLGRPAECLSPYAPPQAATEVAMQSALASPCQTRPLMSAHRTRPRYVAIPAGAKAALTAALVFGASTPFAKQLGQGINPALTAGLLYLGSGLGLGISAVVRPSRNRESPLQRRDLPALLAVVAFGGAIAPLLLLIGLRTTPAATASLLLNLEAVFTAVGAWLIVREHADRRIVTGMIVIVAGGALLSLQPDGKFALTVGAVAIAGACACWGIDNIASRPLADRDPRHVAAVKGIGAGIVHRPAHRHLSSQRHLRGAEYSAVGRQ